jgi:proline racemase
VFTNSVHYFPYKFTKIPSGEMTSPSFACIRTRGAAQAGTGLVARRQRGGEKRGRISQVVGLTVFFSLSTAHASLQEF